MAGSLPQSPSTPLYLLDEALGAHLTSVFNAICKLVLQAGVAGVVSSLCCCGASGALKCFEERVYPPEGHLEFVGGRSTSDWEQGLICGAPGPSQ